MYINDRRIDLTENDDFRERGAKVTRASDLFIKGIFHDFGGVYPYYTGSVNDIRIYMQYFDDVNKCERCGAVLLPWELSLCQKCDEELNVEIYGLMPWEDRSAEWRQAIDNMFLDRFM